MLALIGILHPPSLASPGTTTGKVSTSIEAQTGANKGLPSVRDLMWAAYSYRACVARTNWPPVSALARH